MRGYEFLRANESPSRVSKFDHSDNADPYPQPCGDRKMRHELDQSHGHKHKIRNRVKPCSEVTCAVCPSCHSAVYHIAESAKQIDHTKPRRWQWYEQERQTQYNARARDDVCDVFFHKFLFVHPIYRFTRLCRHFHPRRTEAAFDGVADGLHIAPSGTVKRHFATIQNLHGKAAC